MAVAMAAAGWLVHAAPVQAVAHALTGEARGRRSARLPYREHLVLRVDGTKPVARLVVHRCSDGSAFARRDVDYRASRIAPPFALEGVRSGHREGLRRVGTSRHLWNATRPARALRASPTLVADSGFDEYPRSHRATLGGGCGHVVPFAVRSFGRALDLRITRHGAGAIDGAPVERVRPPSTACSAWSRRSST